MDRSDLTDPAYLFADDYSFKFTFHPGGSGPQDWLRTG